MAISVSTWQDIAAAKRAELDACIPSEWRLPQSILMTVGKDKPISVIDVPATSGPLSPSEIDITENYDATDLIARMASRDLSAEEVTIAFCKRAAIAHQLVNCLTEVFFDEAIETARALDRHLKEHGQTVGPLHGLPISIKDHINIKNKRGAAGNIASLSDPLPTAHATIVEVLVRAGAVLYVKSTVPQTMLVAEGESNVHGSTLNPHKLTLGPGGSSCGEGALIGLRGSVMGLGSDIGGSVRIPSLCCGTYGFKASNTRLPWSGHTYYSRGGRPGVISCAGPLATSARDLHLFLRTVIESDPWDIDHATSAIPWTPAPARSVLRIGLIEQCPTCPVTPPVARCIRTAAQALSDAGHTVIPLRDFPKFNEAWPMATTNLEFDNTDPVRQLLLRSDEPLVKAVRRFKGPAADRETRRYDIEDVFNFTIRRGQIAEQWHKIITGNKLDVLLAPGAEHTAIPHDTWASVPYTVMWNLIDSPAAIIPFLKAEVAKDKAEEGMRVHDWHPEEIEDTPGHVQIIGRPLMDERLAAAVEIIDRCLKDSLRA